MAETSERLATRCAVVYPAKPTLGALGVLAPEDRLNEIEALQQEAIMRVWEVRGIVSDHIPLSGLGALTAAPQHRFLLGQSPLAIFLHRGGDRAVYFDLVANNPEKHLDYIAVKVRTRRPSTAFLLAREPLNRLLDVLSQAYELPLVYQRLDLVSPRDGGILAHEMVLPMPKGIRYEHGGGVHQAEPFAPYEAIFREALTNPSPFYQLLCACRLYEGTNWIRRWLHTEAERLSVDARLPREPRIEPGELELMGLPAEDAAGIDKTKHLFEKMSEARNAIAHFLFEGEEGGSHVYLADGGAFQHYSVGAAVLLRYARKALDDLRGFYRDHIEAHHQIGMVFPMIEHRDRFIVLDPIDPE